MSSRSIVPALFWPQFAPLAGKTELRHCAAEIELLQRQLLNRASHALESGDLAKARRG